VVAFGFPLGTALAVNRGEFPAVNVNRGTIRGIKKAGGDPAIVEADISINPGNSGGPLIDTRGRVVGVIYARVERRGEPGYSLAVPVGRLQRFLSRPQLSFDMHIVARDAWDQPVEFKATATSLFPPAKPPAVELVLGGAGKGERRLPMKQEGNWYRAVAVPSSGAKYSPVVQVHVQRKEVVTDAWVENMTLTWNSVKVLLSDLRSIDLKPDPWAFPRSGFMLRADPAALAPLFAALEQQEPNFARSSVTRITVGDLLGPDMLPCAVVARDAGRPVARIARVLLAQNTERPTLETLSKGQFIRPRRSETPVSSFRLLIPPGNPLGEGLERIREGGAVYSLRWKLPPRVGGSRLPGGAASSRVVTVGLFSFRPPHGRDFEPREYTLGAYEPGNLSDPRPTVEVRCPDFATTPRAAEILRKYRGLISTFDAVIEGPTHRQQFRQSRLDIEFTGRMRVWEFELDMVRDPIFRDESRIRRLAVDFLLQCKATRPGVQDPPPVAGMIRIRSSYE
jgi:hypothetical protein